MAINNSKAGKAKVLHRNKSPYGWWVASYILRFEFDDEDQTNLNRRCLAHENTIILKAKDREEAYRKAIRPGKSYLFSTIPAIRAINEPQSPANADALAIQE